MLDDLRGVSRRAVPGAIAHQPITDILQTLIKTGLIALPATLPDSRATVKEEEQQSVSPEAQSVRTYRAAILAHPIKLTTADVTRYATGTQEYNSYELKSDVMLTAAVATFTTSIDEMK